MGISSLGVGSSILTQSVLDQLRQADTAKYITPITTRIAAETKKNDALGVINASMKNFIDSINELQSPLLYDARQATVVGTSATVTAADKSDMGTFSLNVTQLATNWVKESGSFTAKTDTIANAPGTLNLNINGSNFSIAYDTTTTLDNLKTQINSVAGTKVNASVVQMGATDFRLFVSSVDTGSTQNITITDNSAGLKDTRLTSGLSTIQTGVDANFTFNGQPVVRSSNHVTDLITGLDISLQNVGVSTVSVTQDRQKLLDRVDSFVAKYNAAITELNKATLTNADATVRGAFSDDSTIKNMKQAIQDMFASVGGGVGSLADYGFDIDKSGVMSVNKTTLNAKIDSNSANVKAFFSGGTFTKPDLTTVTVTGAFTEMSTKVKQYTDTNKILDVLQTSINDSISQLKNSQTSATTQLDARYEILQKRFAAYDAMISKINQQSSALSQMIASANKSGG